MTARDGKPWRAPFRYDCEHSHYIESEHPVKQCDAVVKGQPCDGKLKPLHRKRKEETS